MPTPLRRAGRRLLDGIHIPVAAYVALTGLYTILADTPETAVTTAIPPWLNITWAVAALAGGLTVIIATATGRTRAESAGHGFTLFAIALYALVQLVRGDLNVLALATLASVALLRMRALKRSRAAAREAGRILTTGGGR